MLEAATQIKGKESDNTGSRNILKDEGQLCPWQGAQHKPCTISPFYIFHSKSAVGLTNENNPSVKS